MDSPSPIVFILSWNRPIYLWACLDSFFRGTRSPCRFVIADNASDDPPYREVIEGFCRRGMFHAVHLCEDSDPFRFKRLMEEYRDDIGAGFVFLEGDTALVGPGCCWLEIVREQLAQEDVAAVGSRVWQEVFDGPAQARALEPALAQEDLDFLIKRNASMRRYRPTGQPWIEPHNPPLRLLMMKKVADAGIESATDWRMYAQLIDPGWRCPISTEVAHRHLSLSNIYDYPGYSQKRRDKFFEPVIRQ